MQQTEPLRIQLEEREEVAVSQADPEPQKLILETCPGSGTADACGVETVEVEVVVQQPEGPTRILIRIETESGEPLVEREIVAGGNTTNQTGNTTSETTSTTAPPSTSDTNTTSQTTTSPDTVIQNIVVDVKGKDNLVVLTQALEGEAQVVVSASDVTGSAVTPSDGNGTTPAGT